MRIQAVYFAILIIEKENHQINYFYASTACSTEAK